MYITKLKINAYIRKYKINYDKNMCCKKFGLNYC